MKRKVIIGHDGSEQGRDALVLGKLMAEVLDATPVVATVLQWPPYLMGADDLEIAAELDTAELFAVARDYLEGLEPETRRRVSQSPAEALYELIESENATLVVVGSSRRGPMGRVVLGSVTASLLNGAPCPVLVAPRGYAVQQERRMRRLAVAFDGSAEAWAALETATGLAERIHGDLTILTVAEMPPYGYSAALSALTAEEYQSLEKQEKRRILDLSLDRFPGDLSVEGRLLTGDPGSALTEAAKGFDLLVIGSRGYGALRRTLLGSVSAHVVRRAPCPALVLARTTGMDPLGVGRSDTEGAVAPQS